MDPKFTDLKTRLTEIHDINGANGLLAWDQRTMMPPAGAAVRAERAATLGRIAHERFTSDEIGTLLEDLRPYEESLPYDSDEASLIRVARRDYTKAHHVSPDLRSRLSRAASRGYSTWVEARHTANFARFLPALEENVALKHEYVACFPAAAETYDILLDDFEPGMTTAEVRSVFDRLKAGLAPLVEKVAANPDAVNNSCLHRPFPVEKQRAFGLAVVERFGFTPESWRLDDTEHPFASGLSTTDIRITTRYDANYLGTAMFGTMHETGHGLYEHGVSPSLERSLLARGASMALHESQSRMWENLVGRGRPFWRYFFPQLQATFPEQLAGVDAEAFYRAVNKLQPSLIRVEADEATYNLHIILRFELEQEIVEGRLPLEKLPEAWNAKMRELLGVEVPDDALGVLQDTHWSGGAFGYFPTYALGNLVAAQIWERVSDDLPDLEDQFARGEFQSLREWLRENLHRHGRKFTTAETLQRVVGSPAIDPEPYLRYMGAKVDELYG
ncbi:MAG: carboxypeptidase M32 [Chloroflexia bacterium]|nr:carboxypeptidase M32 [Chloroflexia bacterium]